MPNVEALTWDTVEPFNGRADDSNVKPLRWVTFTKQGPEQPVVGDYAELTVKIDVSAPRVSSEDMPDTVSVNAGGNFCVATEPPTYEGIRVSYDVPRLPSHDGADYGPIAQQGAAMVLAAAGIYFEGPLNN